MNTVSVPRLRFSSRVSVEVGKPVEFEPTATVRRAMIPIMGGTVSGDLSGEIVSGGADWQTVRSDGTVLLSARYPVRINGDQMVCFVATGVRPRASIDGGFCSTLRVEDAGDSPTAYPIFVTSGLKRNGRVEFDMFEIL